MQLFTRHTAEYKGGYKVEDVLAPSEHSGGAKNVTPGPDPCRTAHDGLSDGGTRGVDLGLETVLDSLLGSKRCPRISDHCLETLLEVVLSSRA